MNKRKWLIISCFMLAIISLTSATYAYFVRGINGNVVGNVGNIPLVINDADASLNENFSVTLKRSDTEEFVIPGDSGYVDLNVNSTGSISSVAFTVTIDRTGLPNNLKFFVDENYTTEYTSQSYKIAKADSMVKTIRIYWRWEDIDDANDSLFIGKTISASVSISAEMAQPTFADTLIASARNNLDTNVEFGLTSSSENGIGLMMREGTQNDEYPIVYYRGDVSNNNVIFADLCWLIVRTTETGGIKLVFNGPVVENDDGTESCNNYSGVGGETANTSYTDVFAGNTKTQFNTNYDSPVYVGYMYNNVDYTYSKSTLATDYVMHLSDNSIDSETGRHIQNLYDSIIKGVVDAWYEENILGKPEESLLEDVIWCNDRSVISEEYSIENMANGTNYVFYFAAYTRFDERTPSLECAREMDKFTVDSNNGNGDLDYPIGLLTVDEINLAGHTDSGSSTTYLKLTKGGYQWSLSPYRFSGAGAFAFHMSEDNLYDNGVYASDGARPSVSLNNSASISGGNGSFESPYKIKQS